MPSLRRERALLRSGHALVAGMDEVGRGALAGPVSVGVVVVSAASRSAPVGLRDSKLLAPAAREALVPRLRRWARAWAVGHAGPEEIDAVGILAALRLAGQRALAQLPEVPSVVLLDGNLDWLSRAPSSSAPCPSDLSSEPPSDLVSAGAWQAGGAVVTQVGADLRCAAVAAASVLAKVSRDALMVELAAAHPPFEWDQNKGYATPRHVRALAEHGPCGQHRRSWRLPGVPRPGPPGAGPSAGAAAGAGTALHGAAGCMMGADER